MATDPPPLGAGEMSCHSLSQVGGQSQGLGAMGQSMHPGLEGPGGAGRRGALSLSRRAEEDIPRLCSSAQSMSAIELARPPRRMARLRCRWWRRAHSSARCHPRSSRRFSQSACMRGSCAWCTSNCCCCTCVSRGSSSSRCCCSAVRRRGGPRYSVSALDGAPDGDAGQRCWSAMAIPGGRRRRARAAGWMAGSCGRRAGGRWHGWRRVRGRLAAGGPAKDSGRRLLFRGSGSLGTRRGGVRIVMAMLAVFCGMSGADTSCGRSAAGQAGQELEPLS